MTSIHTHILTRELLNFHSRNIKRTPVYYFEGYRDISRLKMWSCGTQGL